MAKKKAIKKIVKKAVVKKPVEKVVKVSVKSEPVEAYTHIDKSNGQLLRKSDLLKDKPWIGPVSGQASVEELPAE